VHVKLVALLILFAMLATACAQATPGAKPAAPPAAVPAPAATSAPARAASAPGAGAQVVANSPALESKADSAAPDRMIIRTGKVNLTVGDVQASVDQTTSLATRLGGFVASSSVRERDGQPSATLSLRVPGARFDDAIRELRGLAIKVDEESSTGQDVTEEFADLGAQLRNQEAAEVQYLELLKRAQSVEDVLKVQQRLTEVRGQIERLKGRMQVLQRRTDLSQIDVTLTASTAEFQPFRHVREAFMSSLRGIEAAIGAVVATWWVLVLVGVGLWALRRRGRRSAPAAPAA
jgi:hypothetical protein